MVRDYCAVSSSFSLSLSEFIALNKLAIHGQILCKLSQRLNDHNFLIFFISIVLISFLLVYKLTYFSIRSFH